MFTNLNMSDVEIGYKAFRGEIIRNMRIVSSRFGFEVEVSAKIAKLGCAVYEVPISYYGRTYDEGKKIGFFDGLVALWLILRFNLVLWVAVVLSAGSGVAAQPGAFRQTGNFPSSKPGFPAIGMTNG